MRPHEIVGVLVRRYRCNHRDSDDRDRGRPPDHPISRHHRAPPTAKDLVRAITPPCPIGRPCPSDTSPWHLTHQTSGEVVADLTNREVERRFEGTDIAFGLSKQQATLQSGESSKREPVNIGAVT
jgi:hypothetical protein